MIAVSNFKSCVFTIGGNGLFVFGERVTECIDRHGLSAEFDTADVTVNNEIIRTVFFAISGNFVFFDRVQRCMTESFSGDGSSFEFVTADVTVNNEIVRACVYTVGSDDVFLDRFTRCVTEGGHFAFVCCLTAVIAVSNFKSCVFAIGSDGLFVFGERVTESIFRYGFSFEFVTADVTVNDEIVRAVFFTGSGNFVFFDRCRRSMFMSGYFPFIRSTATVVTVSNFHAGFCGRGFIGCERMAEGGNFLFIGRITAVTSAGGNFLTGIFTIGSHGLYVITENMAEGGHFDGCSVQFFVTAFICTVYNKVIRAFRFAGCGNFIFLEMCRRGMIFGHGTQRSERAIVFRGICLGRGVFITADHQILRALDGVCTVVNFTVRIIKFNVIEIIITTGGNDRIERIRSHTCYGIGNIQIVHIECAVALNGLLYSSGTHSTAVEGVFTDRCDRRQKYEGIILLALRMADQLAHIFAVKHAVISGIGRIVFINGKAHKAFTVAESSDVNACNGT